MKIKLLLTFFSCAIASSVLANNYVTPQTTSVVEPYYCGSPPQSNTNLNWCQCYENYVKQTCERLGGGEEVCQLENIRRAVDEYGGPSIACYLIPNLGMSHAECKLTSTYYFSECPNN